MEDLVKFLHSMIRVLDLDRALDFFVNGLGLIEVKRGEYEQWQCTLVYLATAKGEPEIELTYNWGHQEPYSTGRSFGHLAFEVENIYKTCQKLQDKGVIIHRPPRDGMMAFVKSPDGISIELLQRGKALEPQEPWASMENDGSW